MDTNEAIPEAIREWFRANGKRGGKARAEALTAERRREIAKKAGKAGLKVRRENARKRKAAAKLENS